MSRCKACKIKFEAVRPLQQVCSYKCAIEYKKAQEKKKWQKEKKQIKESLKTLQDHIKELQIIFNKFIRLRDKNKTCISCDAKLVGKFDAGHFYSVGSYPELRFNEDNVHGQCVYCNQHKHGNLLEYEIRLEKRIGKDRLQELTEKRNNARKYSIPELIELKVIYKEKIKKY